MHTHIYCARVEYSDEVIVLLIVSICQLRYSPAFIDFQSGNTTNNINRDQSFLYIEQTNKLISILWQAKVNPKTTRS